MQIQVRRGGFGSMGAGFLRAACSGMVFPTRCPLTDSPAVNSMENRERWTALSFEEPHPGMLLASGLLLLVTPLGVALHLATTRELTRAEERAWVVGLTGRRGMAFLSAYLERSDRREALARLASGERT
jgi:hypothetical protein